MNIQLKANALVIDGETMNNNHSMKGIAKHLKAVLFGV